MENNKAKKSAKESVVSVYPADVGEYIIYKTEDNEEIPVNALTAFDRFSALLQTLNNATQDALDQGQFERSVWLSIETLKACAAVLRREKGSDPISKKKISEFEKKLLSIEKEFKHRVSKSSKNKIYMVS